GGAGPGDRARRLPGQRSDPPSPPRQPGGRRGRRQGWCSRGVQGSETAGSSTVIRNRWTNCSECERVLARANYQYNMGWDDTSIQPPNLSYDNYTLGGSGPLYRNSRVTYAGVTDGLSNTVVASEKTPYLADASWVGIIPG